jgi:hypothetical protein
MIVVLLKNFCLMLLPLLSRDKPPVLYVYVLVVGQCITDALLIIFYSLVGREVCIRKAKRRHRRSQRISTDVSQIRTSFDFSDEQTPSACHKA